MLALIELVAVAALVLVAGPYARGTAKGFVFLALAAFVAVWGLQAIAAGRRAAQRAAPFTTGAGSGGAVELLWLAPVIVAGATAFWSLSGAASSPDDVVAEYLGLWQAGRAADAAPLLVAPPEPSTLADAWSRERARLTNETIRAGAQAGPDADIDVDDPWGSVRWQDADDRPNGSGVATVAADEKVVEAVIVRRQAERGSFLGVVPTTSVRLVPVASLGSIRLQVVDLPPPIAGAPPVRVWRVAGVDLLGERFGG
ncbi:MAG TPA: hypothetical protein VFR93_07525 [Candidatus Limnocylindrales bacterium]|nr:hypothetical protein [Candidatus Limnocylindrales bacterium]